MTTRTESVGAQQIVPMFGASVRESRIEHLLSDLHTLNRPSASDEAAGYHDWVLVRRKGVELGFADSCYHRAEPRDRWGHGEWLLTQAYFYRGFGDVKQFAGTLPEGLLFSDDPVAARRRMSKFESSRRSYLTDTWDVDSYRLTIKYDQDRQGIDRIACRMLPSRLSPSAAVNLPDLKSMIDSLGEPIQGKTFKSHWRLDLTTRQIEVAVEDNRLDLSATVGAELTLVGGRIRSVVLHRDHDADSVQWGGEVPAGLGFDDSPENLLAKVGQPPVQHANSELTGHAVWHFEDYTLQVLYSHVDNRILRVMLIAPGTWKCIEED